MNPVTVSRETAAAVLGISVRQLARLEAAGILTPVVRGRPGRPAQYDLLAVGPAYVKHVTSPDGLVPAVERARRDRAAANLAEQAFEARSRALLPASEVKAGYGRLVGATKARLLAIPRAIAPQLAAATDPRSVEVILTAAIRAALSELAGRGDPLETRSFSRR
jgi:hypothetical protein